MVPRFTQTIVAFTLIELLVVIGIISIVAGLLFPVFASAREKANSASCTANLHQIGLGMSLYMQDNDGVYPWMADAADKNTNIWMFSKYAFTVKTMPLLNDLLKTYIRSNEVWRCPSDTGFDILDNNFNGNTNISLNARPSMFQAFGSSYMYRTEISLLGKTDTNLTALKPSGEEVGPSEINIVADGCGRWHGSGTAAGRRYNVLMGDEHVVSQNPDQLFMTGGWRFSLE